MSTAGFGVFTPKEFLQAIRTRYKSAQSVVDLDGYNASNVKRARAHSISADAEDLFAQFLAKNFVGEDLFFYVDIPLLCEKYKQACYPDILVCKNIKNKYKILYMFDVKTNTGWFRKKDEIESCAKKLSEHLKNLKESNTIKHKIVDENTQTHNYEIFEIDEDANYDMIILSTKNNNKNNIYTASEDIEKLNLGVHIWALSDSELNQKYSIEDIEPNEKQFLDLYNMLNLQIKKNSRG